MENNNTNAKVGNSHPVNPQKKRKRRRGWKIAGIVFLSFLVFMVIVLIAAPPIAVKILNKKMSELPDYNGHIDKLQLNIFRGSATVKGMSMVKKNGKIPVPFFYSESLTMGLEWSSLWKKGKLVLFTTVDHFQVNLVKGPDKETSQMSIDPKWIEFANKMIPLDVNTMDVKDGEIHYREYHRSPEIDIVIDSIRVTGRNMNNVADTANVLPSEFKMTANCYGGKLLFNAKVNMLSQVPDFDMNAKLTNFPLVKINNVLRAYANFDVQKGTFSVYTEIASKDLKLKGYAEPFIRDLDIIDLKKERKEPLSRRAWESLLELGTIVLKNQEKDQIATRVDISGTIKSPDISVWQVMSDALTNAFGDALIPGLNNSINLRSVGKGKGKETFLEKVFGNGDKEKKPKKKKNKK